MAGNYDLFGKRVWLHFESFYVYRVYCFLPWTKKKALTIRKWKAFIDPLLLVKLNGYHICMSWLYITGRLYLYYSFKAMVLLYRIVGIYLCLSYIYVYGYVNLYFYKCYNRDYSTKHDSRYVIYLNIFVWKF